VARLRRADPSRPGWSRRRAGRGFVFLDESGHRLRDSEVARCRRLSIPPAWSDVWICPWPNGHIQAVGTDAAGRRQYLYHPAWRDQRDREKFDRVVEFARSLPAARLRVAEHLGRARMPKDRALAAGVRILDLGAIRIGGEAYAEDNSSFGLATLRRDHVSTRRGPSGQAQVRLRFPGKSGREHDVVLDDAALQAAVRVLLARRSGGPELLAWRDEDGTWRDVTSTDINDYIRAVTGVDASAKDFRTWQATARAVAVLAGEAPATKAARRTAVATAMRVVAEHLGNTPAVARSSYVDPRVVDSYLEGDPLLLEPPPGPGDTAQQSRWEVIALDLLG
jgi:DNA topoisomerase I